MIIIIDYFETTLFHNIYAKIDSNYHRLPYPLIIITHAKAGNWIKAPCPVAHPQYLSAPPPPSGTRHSRLLGSLETDNDLDMHLIIRMTTG